LLGAHLYKFATYKLDISDNHVKPNMIKLGFFDLLLICINRNVKAIATNTDAKLLASEGNSGDNNFPVKAIMDTNTAK